MTRMLLAAATLVALTTAAMAQGYQYNSPSPYSTYYQQQRPMSYGNPYDRPAPTVGN